MILFYENHYVHLGVVRDSFFEGIAVGFIQWF